MITSILNALKYYLELTLYSNLRPKYSRGASIMELREQNRILKQQLEESKRK